jgi:PKD repeat protein
VTVANVPPSASAGGPYDGKPLEAVTFSGAATDPGARDKLEYAWDFDYRGTFAADAVGVDLTRPSHTYVFPGTYTVALQVRDDDGGVSQVATVAVTIRAPTSTNALVTGSVRWSRDVATLLELHADAGRLWGQARFEGDGRTITATEVLAIVVTGDDVIVFAGSAEDVIRIDAHDGGNPGTGDTYRLRLASGYDSGVLERASGNLVIHHAP